MSHQPEAERIASQIITAVEDVWTAIQDRHPEVPDVVVTFGAGTIGAARGTVRLGHFAPSRWITDASGESSAVHELFIGGEGLSQGPASLLGTLLHEATHALAHARNVKDTSRQGRYHNVRFRLLGEEMGIEVTQAPGIGWSDTSVPETTRTDYAAELADLTAVLRAWRRAEGLLTLTPPGENDDENDDDTDSAEDDEPEKPSRSLAAICACEPKPRRIRLARSVYDLGPILCGECDAPFEEA